jgi:hypothetical protein
MRYVAVDIQGDRRAATKARQGRKCAAMITYKDKVLVTERENGMQMPQGERRQPDKSDWAAAIRALRETGINTEHIWAAVREGPVLIALKDITYYKYDLSELTATIGTKCRWADKNKKSNWSAQEWEALQRAEPKDRDEVRQHEGEKTKKDGWASATGATQDK